MPGATLLDRLRGAVAPRYSVEAEIAAGGMGTVYRAHDTQLARLVAVKVLHPEQATAVAVERFRREGRNLASLRHPNVLSVHDAGERGGLHYLVMDFADGPTLAQRLEHGRLDPQAAHELARGLLAGLAAAHRRDIVHRDVKPSNIFFLDGRPVVGDFGIASSRPHSSESDPQLTLPGARIGTLAYMAPEQASGRPSGKTADVYAAGAVLYEACTGDPWPHLFDPHTADWHHVPVSLRPALVRALAFDPGARWPDAVAFERAVARLVWARHPRVAAGIAAAALGLIAWVVWPSHTVPSVVARADLASVAFTGHDSALVTNLWRFTTTRLGWSPRWSFRTAMPGDSVPARWWFDGDLVMRDGRPSLMLSIHDSSGTTVKETEVPGDTTRIREWAHAIADTVVRVTFPVRLAEFRDATTGDRGDFGASKLMIDGFDRFAAGQWDSAETLLRAAIQRDPSLVQAVWELDLQRKWRRMEISDLDRRRLQSVRGRLPEPYDYLLRTEAEPNLRRRIDTYAAIVEEFPQSGRARFLYLNEAFHRGPLTGMPLDSALRLMRHALKHDPYVEHVTMYDQIVWGYIRLGDRVMADSLMHERKALVRRHGRGDELGALLALVYDARFNPWWGRLEARVAAWKYRKDPRDLLNYLRFGITFDVPSLQVRLASAVAESEDRAFRVTGLMAESLALLQLGRAAAGLERLDSATALLGTAEARVHRLMWRTLPNALGLPLANADAVVAARGELAAIASDTGALAAQSAWALAADAFLRGDAPEGALWRSRLDAMDRGIRGARYLSIIARALEAAAVGRADSALALTDTFFLDDASGLLGGPFARAVLHLQRGHWARESDRPAAAESAWLFHENSHLRGWPRRETQAGEVDAVMSVYARLLRGELAVEQGRRVDGCRKLRRVDQLWNGADTAFDALRERARRAAAACA